MSYKDKSYRDRKIDRTFWNWSESRFEERWEHRWDRFGLGDDDENNNVDLWKLSPFIRNAPDYITQIGDNVVFMEVQGTGGNDRLHKFKVKKLDNMQKWNREHTVYFWLWDNNDEQADIISYNKLRFLIAQGKATKGSFDGHRETWELPIDLIRKEADW